MRRITRVLLAAALLLLLAPAAPAFAHSRLVASDPADGAAVRAPLSAVALTFSDGVKQQFSTVVVTGPDGASYVDGAAHVADRTLTQPLRPLPNGAVRVAWRTVSADGHPIEGQFSFNVSGSAVTATSSAPAAVTTDPGAVPWTVVVVAAIVIVLALGAAILGRRRHISGARRRA
ncbi:copper resistance CopC family protein [Dactylosporangium sp. NPDC049140]|uniref:copper resistance CopC family protein n=1 Tax=Dactylosporangium sp. NPDC049140 TaxID=3155647 RepID=UPI0033EBDFDE